MVKIDFGALISVLGSGPEYFITRIMSLAQLMILYYLLCPKTTRHCQHVRGVSVKYYYRT